MRKDNVRPFFELIRAGLWEKKARLSSFEYVDYTEVYRLSREQSIVGLLAAGVEHVADVKVPQQWDLQLAGEIMQIELQNNRMNAFINQLIGDLRKANIYTLIVKGQGVAQCYERPLWRSSGDIDFYMNEDDFQKAKIFFRPLVDKFDPDDEYTRHINMHYGEWVVEIHANQYCSLSPRINKVLDHIHEDLFYKGSVRSWLNGTGQVFLPSADNDVIIVFTHFLRHFFVGGLGLRQICDWTRQLWVFKDILDLDLLKKRLVEMNLMSEWMAFGVFAVEYLGMPVDAMPFYSDSDKLKKKADRICDFVLEVGNFGHNRDSSYYGKYSFLVRKTFSFIRRCGDMIHHSSIFPFDSFRFLINKTISGIKHVAYGNKTLCLTLRLAK